MNDSNQRNIHKSNRIRRRFKGFPQCLAKYKDHFSFLRDSKFLEDLENDSVDSDIIDEELNALHQVPISKRERVVKFLQSNPVQILLCVIVLLDAGIVIAQILLDLNSVKERLYRRDIELSELLAYIRDTHADKLYGYPGTNVDLILRLLRRYKDNHTLPTTTTTTSMSRQKSDHQTLNDSINRNRSAVQLSNTTTTTTTTTSRNELHNWHGDSLSNASSFSVNDDFHQHVAGDDYVKHSETLHLHEVAHWLHFASISLLGFLVVEDLIKMIAMGWTFCRHKIEIVDAVIISSSFTIDLVFLNGVSGEEGQKAAAILVVLLLWRIARVVDGIVVTVKQRQEFRIRLQKRARRLAERKVETYEEERNAKNKQIDALKDLCCKAGISDADIASCAPKQSAHVTNTLNALSSVAKLSVSMTMLMSSGVHRGPGPLAADGSVSLIEDSFDVKSDSVTAARCPPLRIESLPNIQNGSSTPAHERRKAFSSKLRPKQLAVAEQNRRLSVLESAVSLGSVDAMTVTTHGSPINNCGIRIVINQSFDVEKEVDNPAAVIHPSSSGLTFGDTDDRDIASNSQMFLLSDI